MSTAEINIRLKAFAEYLQGLDLYVTKTNGVTYYMEVDVEEIRNGEVGEYMPYLCIDSITNFTFDGSYLRRVSASGEIAEYFINHLYRQFVKSQAL